LVKSRYVEAVQDVVSVMAAYCDCNKTIYVEYVNKKLRAIKKHFGQKSCTASTYLLLNKCVIFSQVLIVAPWWWFFLRLLYFYPQSILDYQYMYVISTTIVYRDLIWGVVFQQTRSILFYFCVKLFVMRICEADQLVCSVWAVAVLGPPVGWVLVDLCWSSLALWAMLRFVISSRTVSMSRSVCRMLLGMYHGALVIVLRTLFWNRCKISVLEWEAVPQRGIP